LLQVVFYQKINIHLKQSKIKKKILDENGIQDLNDLHLKTCLKHLLQKDFQSLFMSFKKNLYDFTQDPTRVNQIQFLM